MDNGLLKPVALFYGFVVPEVASSYTHWVDDKDFTNSSVVR